jgi:3-oxoacyl-[acyl-carrier-protein] synthase-3
MTYAAITGWGKCMPPSILSNADLASLMETDDEWITSRTGIKERRVSHVTGIELSHVAAARALACAGLDRRDVELIVYGSCSNDETVPQFRVRRASSGSARRRRARWTSTRRARASCTVCRRPLR